MNSQEVEYEIVVKTGKSSCDGNVVLCIFGDKNNTPNLPLRPTNDEDDHRFEKDSSLNFSIKSVDVGKIKRINIGHDGEGAEKEWFLESVTINKNGESFHFEANRWLSEQKDDKKTYVDLYTEKEKENYKISVVRNPSANFSVKQNVFLTIFGETEQTKTFSVEGKRKEQNESFSTELDDVGKIKKIRVERDENDTEPNFEIEWIEIEKKGEKFHFVTEKILNASNKSVELFPVEKRNSTPKIQVEPKKRNSLRETPTKRKETLYRVLIRTSHIQEEALSNESDLFVILEGDKGQSEKLFLVDGQGQIRLNKSETTEVEFRLTDLGKIHKLFIGQENSNEGGLWHIENAIVKHLDNTITFNVERSIKENSTIELFPSVIPKKIEFHYKIILHTGLKQQEAEKSPLLISIYGSNGTIENVPLDDSTAVKKIYRVLRGESADFETRSFDIGKIWKIVLSQNPENENLHWHIDHVLIKASGANTNFYADQKLEPNERLELFPASLPSKSARSSHRSRNLELSARSTGKLKETDYEITVVTGKRGLDNAVVTIHLHGDVRVIPLTLKSSNEQKPFQSNSIDHFLCRAVELDRIRRIHVEHNGTDSPRLWNLKSVQIKTDKQTINFPANLCLDDKKHKVTLYSMVYTTAEEKEDFVQLELRRLRESLRAESSKIRAPAKKDHRPFIHNDLGPYFDTTPVDRAIHAPLDTADAYYTRLTALRIVEPWESHGMDYGVNYELMRHRGRSLSAPKSGQKLHDESIDRSKGSTHLPKFPCVAMRKPRNYVRVLTVNDVPRIRSYIKESCTSQATEQIKQDYERTRDDFYRMQLDNMESYRESNRENMREIYHAYLQNTPGSRKALREFCN